MNPVWTYVSMVDRLSGGDITKDQMVLEMDYTECLQRLLFWMEKDEYDAKMAKINQKLSK